MFDRKKCIESFIVYLDEANENPGIRLELYLKDGSKIKVPVNFGRKKKKTGKLIYLTFKPKSA
jgi:hypothetical protein